MIDLLTLKRLRGSEAAHKNSLVELPPNFIQEVKNLMDLSLENEDYSDFMDIIHYFRLINELRQSKIVRFVIYRSKGDRVRLTDIDNIRDDEHDLFLALQREVIKHNEYIDSLFDGQYMQKSEKIGGLNGETKES
jgi:hypothetical protein